MILLALAKGIEFECEFWERPSSNGNHYTCEVYKGGVTLRNNLTSLESIQGDHESEKSNDDVRGLRVWEDNVMQQLPKNIDAIFQNFEFYLWNSGILTSVKADDFRPFPEMTYLDLCYNKIATLDGDLFKHTPRLTRIIFHGNLITSVGKDIFSSMKALEGAFFRDNLCISSEAEGPVEIQELEQMLSTQCSPVTATHEATIVSAAYSPTSLSSAGECHLHVAMFLSILLTSF